ncbi:acyltransferase family protein [Novosphingobium taihuense]|uniref:acyltransferase family protein n=1 Tax=Novosphingobium taihuense TaxID=260085 RepID=UPI00119B4E3B|nr:acyltransferase family protein [Novosphingobium taihuense]TWH88408.1 peptidoglycan/LPS O-acetylase OafA/YrhL [Novosphingobium taihuense]
MQQRREIEGLRALAVIPVVLFHARIPGFGPGFGGGFAGVDVFFVISGYLITATILENLAAGQFSLVAFYERRARRILPALLAVLIASGVLAWAVLIPEDFRKFSQGLASSGVFASNLLFAQKTGYFDDDEGFRPLLHTWSLSVEEQFYILFPALIIVLWRFGRGRMPLILAGLGVLSLGLCLALAPSRQEWAFYLLPTRAWELLAGAACAALPATTRQRPALALSGLSLIFGGFILADAATAPDWRLTLPVVGAALVVRHASPSDPAGRLLGAGPLVAIGGASYGIYLWHNPLLAFLGYVWWGTPPLLLTGLAIALSFLLGFASLHLVERPIRARRWLGSRQSLAWFCGGGLVLALAAGLAGHLERLLPASAARRNALLAYPAALPEPATSIPASGQPVRYLLYGDSHARQYFTALNQRAAHGAMLTDAGCFALPGVTNYAGATLAATECMTQPDALVRLVRERGIGTVILAHRWDRILFEQDSFRRIGQASTRGRAALEAGLDRLRATLPEGTRIVLVGNVPTAAPAGVAMAGGYLRCLAYINATCPAAFPAELAEGHRINPVLADYAARHQGVSFFDPATVLCAGDRCDVVRDGHALYVDDTHLTRRSADAVVARMVQATGRF